METQDRFLIIGAGPSGLAAGRALKDAAIPFEIVERHWEVGGVWSIDNPDSPMYESAHYISSKSCSAFADCPFPDDYPDYPTRKQVLDYTRTFADYFGLHERIRFKTSVERVRPADGKWEVDFQEGPSARYRGIIAGVGHTWIPNPASYPGEFTGEVIHSSRYKSAAQFEGKRVLVVGGGNSGCDIACDAAIRASRAILSLRRGYHFLPKQLFGKPTDAFFRSGPELPLWLARPLLAVLLRLYLGDLTRLGLPKPDHKVLASHPIVNSQILHHLSHGNLTVKPDVAALEGGRVRFVDGTDEPVDLVVYATGYKPLVPCLSEVLPSHADGTPNLFAQMFVPEHRKLFVLGHFESDGAHNPLVSLQAQLVAAVIRARRDNRPAYLQFKDELAGPPPDLSGGLRRLDTPRHHYYAQLEAYAKYLRKTHQRLTRPLKLERAKA